MADRHLKNMPGLASTQAQSFVTANPVDPDHAPDAASIDAFRDETAASFVPRAQRMLERHAVAIKDIVIGGVDCIEVIPTGVKPTGTVLYCYGGGFICGSAFEDLIIAAPLAAHVETRLILPKYPLAPEHPWPAAIDAGYAVYRTLLKDHASAPLAIAGESAGGNMALSILHRARRDGLEMPLAAALLSPWCDLEHGGDSLTANDGRDPTLMYAWVKAAASMYHGANDPSQTDISPLNGPFDPTYPPAMITTGTRDLLMSQGVRLARVLHAAGVPVDLRVWDGLWHVFEFYDELPEADTSVREIASFLKHHITGADAS